MAVDVSLPREDDFALRQVTAIEWTVEDTSRDPDDVRRIIARVYEADEFEYDVVWLRDLALPTKYMCPADVLDDVRNAARRASRIPSQKPIPIPHRAPVVLAAF